MYSLPTDLFDLAVDSATHIDPNDFAGFSGVNIVLDLVDSPSIEIDMASLANLTFFEVLCSDPTKRYQLPLPHIDSFGDIIQVNLCTLASVNEERGFAVLYKERDQVKSLRVLPLIAKFHDVLPKLFHWSLRSAAPVKMAAYRKPMEALPDVAVAEALQSAPQDTLAVAVPADGRLRARLPAVEVQRRKAHDIAREHVAARERCRILERVAVKDPFVQVGDRLRASRARAG